MLFLVQAPAGGPEAVEGGAQPVQEEVACKLLVDLKQLKANPAGHEIESAGTDTPVHTSYFLSSPTLQNIKEL